MILIPSKINCISCICQQYCDMKKSWHSPRQDKTCAVIFYTFNTNFCCKEELNSLLTNVKEESKKVGLKLNIQKTKIMASGHHFMVNRWGNKGNSDRFIFGAPKSPQMVTAVMKLKDAYSLEGKL